MKSLSIGQLKTATIEDLSNVKMVVNNRAKAKAIQEAVFRLGGEWLSSSRDILYSTELPEACKFMSIEKSHHGLVLMRDRPSSRHRFYRAGMFSGSIDKYTRIVITK